MTINISRHYFGCWFGCEHTMCLRTCVCVSICLKTLLYGACSRRVGLGADFSSFIKGEHMSLCMTISVTPIAEEKLYGAPF